MLKRTLCLQLNMVLSDALGLYSGHHSHRTWTS